MIKTDEELIKKLNEIGATAETLDDAVQAAADAEASFVNNTGMEEQIHYLVNRHGWSHQDIFNFVK